MYEFHRYLRPILLVLHSFWIPQIVTNIVSDSRKPLHPHYIIGMSLTRLAIPLYVFGCPHNFMRIEPDKNWCITLGLLVSFQAAVLILQHYLGSRCFIPRQVFFLLFNKILKGRVCLESEIPFYNTILDLDALRFQFLPFLTDINVAIRWCLVRRNPMVWPLEFEIKKKNCLLNLKECYSLVRGCLFIFPLWSGMKSWNINHFYLCNFEEHTFLYNFMILVGLKFCFLKITRKYFLFVVINFGVSWAFIKFKFLLL